MFMFQEEEVIGGSNGWHNGTQYFSCPDGKGIFVPFSHFRLEKSVIRY